MPVQCNHYLVVLLSFKLPFELNSYYCARTDNHSPTRHQPPSTTGFCINLFLSKVSLGDDCSSLKVSELPTVAENTVLVQLFVWIISDLRKDERQRSLFNHVKGACGENFNISAKKVEIGSSVLS